MDSKFSLSQQSRILNFLRFPLACMVVIIHCKINESGWVLPQWSDGITGEEFSTAIQILFSNILCGIAVPIFYLISGYFFFYGTDGFAINSYHRKLKKRVRTLLVPYILWNLLYVFYVVSLIFMGFIVKNEPLSNIETFFEGNGWLRMFWDCNVWGIYKVNILGHSIPNSGPILIPMWFIRDLMVVIIISPIIYFLLRKLKLLVVVVLALCYITGIWPNWHGFSVTAIFFFSIGAYFSIYKMNIINELAKLKNISYVISFSLLILLVYLNGRYSLLGGYIYPFYIIVGVIAVINVVAALEKREKLFNLKWSDATFFIYAFHGLIGLTIAEVILGIIFSTDNNCWWCIIIHYLLKPILTVCICLMVYDLMRKSVPRFLNVLTGNRR